MNIIHVKKQKGVALFIVLILLVVLTTLSLSAMRGAVTETKISGNFQHRQQVFQATENMHETLLALPVEKIKRPTGGVGSFQANVISIEGDNQAANNVALKGQLDLTILRKCGPAIIPGYELDSEQKGITYQSDATGEVEGSGARVHTRVELVLPIGKECS